MRIAFKEWAVVVDALGRGEQIVILRKGGISEGRGGFKVEHERFLLFPTRFHLQRESVLPAAQLRFHEISQRFGSPERVKIEFLAEVISARKLDSLADAERLRGQHIWRDEVIAERFDWGRSKSIFALATRVFRLAAPVELPMRESYGGCKSWVEIEEDISMAGAVPVLPDAAFAEKLGCFEVALKNGLSAPAAR